MITKTTSTTMDEEEIILEQTNGTTTTTTTTSTDSFPVSNNDSNDDTTVPTTNGIHTIGGTVENSTYSNNVVVQTKYGIGTIINQQSHTTSSRINSSILDDHHPTTTTDDAVVVMYEIVLHNMTNTRLYCPADTILSLLIDVDDTNNGMDVSTASTSHHSTTNIDDHERQSMMELNVAYESLETMRKLNLEMKCQEMNILYTPQDLISTCATCLLYHRTPCTAQTEERTKKRLISKYIKTKAKVSPNCLICGTPTCSLHSSKSFKKENIIMCNTCEQLFGLSYVIQILTCPNHKERRQYIDTMIELYDRTILLLRFITNNSSSNFDDICTALQQSTIRKNHVGIGSSSAGIVSGVLGIVSAATIFTPIGPPLLIASLVFGGSATAAQTGTQIRNSSYCSEPHRIADKIIALHGICWNILRVTGTLRDALLLDHLRTDLYTETTTTEQDKDGNSDVQHIMLTGSNIASSPISEYFRTHQHEVLAKASNIGSIGAVGMVGITAASMEVGGAVTAVETGIVATRGATFMSRSGTAAAALNALQFARFAGGTLAAATLLFEAHNLKNTIQAIRAGNACEKVNTIKRIRDLVRDIPSTQSVDAECERYLQALIRRQRILTEEEVNELIAENNEIIQEVQEIAKEATLSKSKRKQKRSSSTAGGGGTSGNEIKSDTGSEHDDDSSTNSIYSNNSNNALNDISERSRESIARRLQMFTMKKRNTTSTLSDDQDYTTEAATATNTAATSSLRHPLSLRERIELHKKKETQATTTTRSTSPSQMQLRVCNNDDEYDNYNDGSQSATAEHVENLIC